MRLFTSLAFLSLFLSSSCATLFTGTRDQILFTSEPSGVKVVIDGYAVGKTPILLDVRRQINGRWVGFELEGYEDQYLQLPTQFNGVSILNLTCILCWGVDLITGAVSTYTMPSVFVEMEPTLPVGIRKID
ncbi:PEGA domain-containing protein [Neolewinella lacunae]|uniref:PEGA domain-containing protein n=1 Tax=Neolewinella lacunae TaxID=1517758 RepID=A0A923PKI8_9BACT|nr:PEGA domain-containing protein [Neolewinella lacunae]MBC6992898.1 PEGA domain-containing protein [Neolewinella lacunae]MDN3633738.1 PEGA domain-containing protein [Neolewinella lacunae]